MKGLYLTYVLGYGGSLAAIFLPFAGLCTYYSFSVLRPEDLWHYAVSPEGFSQKIAIATLIGWGLRGFPHVKDYKGTFPILLALVCFALFLQVSATMGVDPARSEHISLSMLKIALMAFVGFCLLNSPRRLEALLWVYIVSQGYVAFDLNLETLLSGRNIILERDGFGTLNNNTFALSLLPGIGLALMTSIFESRILLRGIAAFSALASIHIVLLSASRGGYLGLIAMGLLGYYFMPKNRATIPVFLFVLLVTAVLAGEPVRTEFMSMFADKLDTSATRRFDMWSAAFQIMLEHPLLGIGPGNFGLFSGDFQGLESESAVHNLYFQMASECGITGLCLLLCMYFVTLRGLVNSISWRGEDIFTIDPVIASVITGTFAGLAGYLIHSFFSSGVIIEAPYIAMVLGGTAVRFSRSVVTEVVREESPTAALTNA